MSRKLLALGLGAVLALAACGSDDGDAGGGATTTAANAAATAAPSTTTAATFPVTLKTAEGDVTLAAQPTKIVSLSPTATEVLFAVGAGSQVEAVDDQSNYPPEAPKTDLSGFQPNLEAVLAKTPDLVVMEAPGDVADGLKLAKVPVLVQAAAKDLDGTYAQIEQLGVATGHVAEAAKVVADMQSDIKEITAQVQPRTPALTYYHELDPTLYSATSKTFIGQIYALAGLENIADAADSSGSGYPQLSSEYIVQQNPDMVFLGDTKCCQQSLATVAARPGWNVLKAVEHSSVVPLDDDIASRWGPRVVDLLRSVVDATNQVPVG